MADKNTIDWIAFVLVIIGAINWGLVGAFNFNLVGVIFASVEIIATIIYILVGLAGLYMIYYLSKK